MLRGHRKWMRGEGPSSILGHQNLRTHLGGGSDSLEDSGMKSSADGRLGVYPGSKLTRSCSNSAVI